MENSEKSSSPAPSTSAAGGKEKIEKQARQLAYDTRYKVKQSMAANKGGKLDPAAVRKAYIAQLGKSPSSPPVKARAKEMLVGEEYINTDQLVHKSAVSVLEKVFSEKYKGNPKSKPKKPEGGDRRPGVACEEVIGENTGEKTYKVRVTDKKTNNTYVRMATRAKISELRSNPNISSVEMTGYGSPTKSEKHSGKNTAAVKSGKGDEISGKDNKINLKKESYSALRSENFDGFLELIEYKKDKKKKITGEGVNNKKLIKVFPDDVEEQVDPAQKDIESKQKKQSQLKKQVLQKKLQAVRTGGGEDITASYQPEGEVTEAKSKGKKEPRWQDDDCDGKWYEKSDTDGKISKREKKEKAKHYNEEEYDNTKSPDYEKKKKALAKKHGGADKIKDHPQFKEGYQRDPDRQEKERKTSKQTDPSKAGFTGISNDIGEIMRQNAAMKKAAAKKKGVKEDAQYGYDKDGDSLNPKDIKKKNEKDPNGEAKKQEEEDPRGMATKINLVRNKLRAMGLKMSQELEGETIEESEKVAQGAQKRATELGAKRRQASYKKYGANVGSPGKNERAGYNLARKARSADSSPETQVTKKKKPAGYDTSQIGHERKRDEKTSVGKSGKKLKTPKYKLSFKDRQTHHTRSAFNRKDPKQNPKHTANESVENAVSALDAYMKLIK